jgi:EAL domain-containing protein (putative c-di-GMP-specific phosphodiesterase class I)/AmiR/NasT family two-component response regulator
VVSPRNIAVLDDDSDLREEICELLIGAGHLAVGLAGADDLVGSAADILVLDLAMPGVDGVDVLARLAKLPISPSVILISGHGQAVLHAASRGAQAAGLAVLGVLTKPVDPERLLELLETKFRSSRKPLSLTAPSIRPQVEQALTERTLDVHFQPKVRVSDLGFAGAEALLAGTLPGAVHAPPPLIIESARSLPLGIIRLTQLVHSRAVAAVAAWTKNGHSGTVSVNLPLEALLVPGGVATLEAMTRDAGIEPSQVTFELLEDALYDTSADALGTLTKLRLAGFGLALDDLGQRQSGLLQLANLPVTEIKIDLELVRQARTLDKARSIFATLAALGERLGVKVTAEGVETDADLRFVRQHPVDYLQGFLVSAKRPLGDLLTWLDSRPGTH